MDLISCSDVRAFHHPLTILLIDPYPRVLSKRNQKVHSCNETHGLILSIFAVGSLQFNSISLLMEQIFQPNFESSDVGWHRQYQLELVWWVHFKHRHQLGTDNAQPTVSNIFDIVVWD